MVVIFQLPNVHIHPHTWAWFIVLTGESSWAWTLLNSWWSLPDRAVCWPTVLELWLWTTVHHSWPLTWTLSSAHHLWACPETLAQRPVGTHTNPLSDEQPLHSNIDQRNWNDFKSSNNTAFSSNFQNVCPSALVWLELLAASAWRHENHLSSQIFHRTCIQH